MERAKWSNLLRRLAEQPECAYACDEGGEGDENSVE